MLDLKKEQKYQAPYSWWNRKKGLDEYIEDAHLHWGIIPTMS